MHRKHAIFVMVITGFLLLNGLSILFLTEQTIAAGREIYVDDSFSYPRDGTAEHPYQKISEALTLANEGDTIYVFGGVYNETLIINKRISIIGGIDDHQSIISRGAEVKYLVDITVDFVTLENFVIADPGRYITSQYGALIHVSSNNVVLQKNNISQCNLWGIYLDSSDDNTISGNDINDTKGIYVLTSNNNVFSDNNISNASNAGIDLRSSNRNILYQNLFTTSSFGIYARDCLNTNITQNTITKNMFHGLYASGDRSDIIRENRFINNTVTGITLDSSDCTLFNNIFDRGQIGLSLQGIENKVYDNSFENLSSTGISTITGSQSNIIYLNHFLDNGLNAREQGDNQWDNDVYGNYWDDYNYVDRNRDGIGDRPYAIATGGLDRYPVGIFLNPPQKPFDPSPADDAENVGLSVTLWVTVVDPDNSIIPEVTFYNAVDNVKIGTARNVVNRQNASVSFRLPFDTTYAWYATANDSLQENQSDIWFFTTKQRPPENQKPVANPGGPYESMLNQSVSFNGSNSIDPDGTIIFYRWNFGDGSSQILDKTPKHFYNDPGVYTVTLTVVDDDGRSSMANTTATIQGAIFVNKPPIAMFTSPATVFAGDEVSFDASASNDSDGTIVGYRWDFDSNGTFDTEWLTVPAITTTFSSVGSSIVTLEVIDDEGAISSYSNTILITAVQKKSPGFDILFVLLALFVGFILYRKYNG
jgi:parallel beta-helix repeat protein